MKTGSKVKVIKEQDKSAPYQLGDIFVVYYADLTGKVCWSEKDMSYAYWESEVEEL